ncbi:MAG: hypothetical protein GTO14_18385 [Anaerolineales bacterium]|nr:hypothetical protein [Anaerolineales bacterium]
MNSSGREKLNRVNLIRFVLPIALFLIVLSYETWEHLLLTGNFSLDVHYTSEILFFGTLGPLAVFAVLSYTVGLLRRQVLAAEELEALNQNLEIKVAERTQTLAERNAELARANKDLKQLDQLKSDFVALVSHELRGPLTTLNGGIELALQTSEHIMPEARRVLEVMGRESQRLMNFVQTILDVSKLEAGKLEFNPGVVAIRPLLQSIVDILWPGGEREVRWDVPKDLPLVWADEIFLEQIMCNLLTNADKYSPSDMPVEITSTPRDGFMEITIVDYGPGIPANVQDMIFGRFIRLEGGERINSKGWGLGLYFSRALTEAQGGRLEVRSPVHEKGAQAGSAFKVSLPLAEEVPNDA